MISLYFFSFVLLSPLHFFMHLVLMPCLLWLRSLLFYTFHWILGLINIIICTFIILYCDPVLFQLFLIIAFATCYCSWALTPSPPQGPRACGWSRRTRRRPSRCRCRCRPDTSCSRSWTRRARSGTSSCRRSPCRCPCAPTWVPNAGVVGPGSPFVLSSVAFSLLSLLLSSFLLLGYLHFLPVDGSCFWLYLLLRIFMGREGAWLYIIVQLAGPFFMTSQLLLSLSFILIIAVLIIIGVIIALLGIVMAIFESSAASEMTLGRRPLREDRKVYLVKALFLGSNMYADEAKKNIAERKTCKRCMER